MKHDEIMLIEMIPTAQAIMISPLQKETRLEDPWSQDVTGNLQSTITNNRLTMYAMKYDLLKHHKAYAVHAFKGCNVSHINTKIKKIEETHHNTICSPFPKHRRYPLNTPQHRDCRLH